MKACRFHNAGISNLKCLNYHRKRVLEFATLRSNFFQVSLDFLLYSCTVTDLLVTTDMPNIPEPLNFLKVQAISSKKTRNGSSSGFI